MLKNLAHYYKKIKTIGILRTYRVCQYRMKHGIEKAYQKKWVNQQLGHTWQQIISQQNYIPSFDTFIELTKLRSLSFLTEIYSDVIDDESIINYAHLYINNCFDLLGSGLQCFSTISWHTDFRLQAEYLHKDCDFDADSFYKDIPIESGDVDLQKDIKVPWELSRFTYLYVLGRAYELTKDEKYVVIFVDHITDWLEKNPFMRGINWLNPMEVGIRAINWIVAYEFFKDAHISQSFFQKFVCSLYDHMMYLENNWELYDGRTNNHYLTDLLGYYYVCWFFAPSTLLGCVQDDREEATAYFDFAGCEQKIMRKAKWCFDEFLREIEWQIFDDGTAYEGSTTYHRLDTEIIYHFYLLSREFNFALPGWFLNKLYKMFIFIDWCTPNNGEFVQIGDNDSGTILFFGLPGTPLFVAPERSEAKLKDSSFLIFETFSNFGISVIKTEKWHVTLRHHAYNDRQPSGHFHNDVASITLAIDGIPVIVDPGSYVYSASRYWRNYFRSAFIHNAFFLDGIEPVALDSRLFVLDLPSKECLVASRYGNKSELILTTEHELYALWGLKAQRQIMFDKSNNEFVLRDLWIQVGDCKNELPKSCWNFTLEPGICAYQKKNDWILSYKNKPLLLVESDNLDFSLQPVFMSKKYGVKIQTYALRAQLQTLTNDEVTIRFTKI